MIRENQRCTAGARLRRAGGTQTQKPWRKPVLCRLLHRLTSDPARAEGVHGGTRGSPMPNGGDMAVRMRLTRVGSKKNPIYRVVVADSRSPRDGKFIEIVGRYNPQTDPSTIEFDEEKVKDWLGKGVQPSGTVARLLKIKNLNA